jgi:electron transfer flavoprotein alpha subunit
MDFSYLDDWTDEEEATPVSPGAGEGYRNVWVFAEVQNGGLVASTLQAMAQARDLADQIGVYAFAILFEPAVDQSNVKRLIACGADTVMTASAERFYQYQPAVYTQALAQLVNEHRPEILLMGATSLGSDLAPRLAEALGTGLLSHCIKLDLDMAERLLLGTYASLGGEVYQTASCPEIKPQIATLEPGFFRQPYEDDYRSGDTLTVELDEEAISDPLTWIDLDTSFDLPQAPLSKARIVVAGGRGMVTADGFQLVAKLADALGGAVGGSRGAFDEGWIDEDQIIGVGAATIAPDLYIACGIAGDLYHRFGAQDAKFVVAINRDPEAPMMKTANMAIIGDAQAILGEMLHVLQT